jgi:hypothetical protein
LPFQISTGNSYREYPALSVSAEVHGTLMGVASLEDTLACKVAAWSDLRRRPGKRQKDLLDIMRLVESHPELRSLLPHVLLTRL